MPTQRCKLNLNSERREMDARGTPMFPCGGYNSDLEHNVTGDIPWHWHEEIEVIVVRSGAIHIDLDGMDFILREGEGAFINSNILHTGQIVGNVGCTLDSFVFHKGLISGVAESVFEQRYVRPLLSCCTLPGIPLYYKTEWQHEAIQCIREAYEIYETEKFGYELLVREKLSHMWYLIVANMQVFLEHQSKGESQDTIRIKAMMDFLHQHYNEPLELHQVAATASISTRECLRCFQKTIGMPPLQYLLKYRISVAARILADTDEPITEVCKQSGFDNPSYFSKIFKRFMNCTPTSYRKKQ